MRPTTRSAGQSNVVNRRLPNGAPNRPATPNYAVQPPVPVGGHNQQIRATLSGTRQIAGSVDIRAAGAGKGYIANLKVDQEHRRRGVAAKLIDAAVNTARRQ